MERKLRIGDFSGYEVLFSVENVRHEITGQFLPPLQVPQSVVHHQTFQCVLSSWVVHPQHPGQPLQEDRLHPLGHIVGLHRPLVVVEDEDGADHAAGYHYHDAGEVGSDQGSLAGGRHHAAHHVHEEGQGHQDCDAQGQLLSRVRRGVEAEYDHAGDDDAGDDQVVEVVDRPPLDDEGEGDVQVDLRTAGVGDHVPGGAGTNQLPLGVLLVAADVGLADVALEGEVDQSLVVGPGSELQSTILLIKGKPSDVYFAS